MDETSEFWRTMSARLAVETVKWVDGGCDQAPEMGTDEVGYAMIVGKLTFRMNDGDDRPAVDDGVHLVRGTSEGDTWP